MRPLLRTLVASVAVASGCAHGPGAPPRPADGAIWPEPPAPARVRLSEILADATPPRGRAWWKTAAAWIAGSVERDDGRASLVRPFDVVLEPSGTLLVADADARRVLRYDARGLPIAELGCSGRELVAPMGLARGPDGAVFIADAGAAEIVRWTPAGCRALRGSGMQRPTGVAVVGGRVVVADPPAHQIVVLSLEGEEIGRWGERGSDPGQFQFPSDVAAAPDGSFWVVDALNFRIVHLGPDGRWLGAFGEPGEDGARLTRPKGIDVDGSGRIYVSDAERDVVLVFTDGGALDYVVGAPGAAAGRFAHPAGVSAVRGRIAVADSLNRRVQVFEALGAIP